MKRVNEIIAYFHACRDHNWFYNYSEILDVAIAGEFDHAALKARCKGDEELTRVFEAWKAYYFSGPPFGTEKSAEPRLDQFI